MSDVSDVMSRLEACGTAQNRKVYPRHGVQGELFGVSYADLGRLRKEVGVDHELALGLWDTGNHDARVLATMVADPERADWGLLRRWAADLDNYVLTDAFSKYVAAGPLAEEAIRKWTTARAEWTGRTGWLLVAHLAMEDGGDDDVYGGYLEVIEARVHRAPNRVRDAMNSALIAIGARSDALEALALAAAARIGEIDVDHGETNCTTPAATAYIPKARDRNRKREAKAAARG